MGRFYRLSHRLRCLDLCLQDGDQACLIGFSKICLPDLEVIRGALHANFPILLLLPLLQNPLRSYVVLQLLMSLLLLQPLSLQEPMRGQEKAPNFGAGLPLGYRYP